jgi:hypothetical protein
MNGLEGTKGGIRMRRAFVVAGTMLALAALVSCAPGPNNLATSPDKQGDVAGFWLGLWHGFIVFFTFIVSLFKDNVHIYEVHNNGNWYNLGFVIGVMAFFGGGGASRRSCNR